MAGYIREMVQIEQLNFLLTNYIPRRLCSRLITWYSRIESPALTRFSLAVWELFTDDLNLQEAKKQHFRSLHECFIRELREGARKVDKSENVITSPCDGIVGIFGKINRTELFQAKGFAYTLQELIPDPEVVDGLQNGVYVTLRLRSSMYHRFHAPTDCSIEEIIYISGDTWNVNPIALKRIEKLFCKNERAVVRLGTHNPGRTLVLVPVAAILVASMKFHCLEFDLDMGYNGPTRLACQTDYRKGQEIGYFQHGSTIIVLADSGFRIAENINAGQRINMGAPLLIEK